MRWMTTPLIESVARHLDLNAQRAALIASNMANIDTPGYRTRDIDFERELRRAETQLTPEPRRPSVREVPGLLERPDGNNVSLERETMLLAQTQLQFGAGVQLLRDHFRLLLTAITEGR